MAKEIVVDWGGRGARFDFGKVDRHKLYGVRKRVALDGEGRPCGKGELTADGSLLLRAGMTAQGYFDEDDRWLPLGELESIGPEGDVVPAEPSTLGEPQAAREVPPEAVLDARVHAVYALDPKEIDPELADALQGGAVLQIPFNYRPGQPDQAFLVANDEGFFALVGRPTTPRWCELSTVAVEAWDDDDGLDDELDFEMF